MSKITGLFPQPCLIIFSKDANYAWDDNRFQGIPRVGKVTVSKPLKCFVIVSMVCAVPFHRFTSMLR